MTLSRNWDLWCCRSFDLWTDRQTDRWMTSLLNLHRRSASLVFTSWAPAPQTSSKVSLWRWSVGSQSDSWMPLWASDPVQLRSASCYRPFFPPIDVPHQWLSNRRVRFWVAAILISCHLPDPRLLWPQDNSRYCYIQPSEQAPKVAPGQYWMAEFELVLNMLRASHLNNSTKVLVVHNLWGVLGHSTRAGG